MLWLAPRLLATSENSGLRSWPRPAGFHDAAVPSSESATNAFAMPAARAPEPIRVSTVFCAEACAAPSSNEPARHALRMDMGRGAAARGARVV
jgi:hypothetical protein